jgi:hypothetical protein
MTHFIPEKKIDFWAVLTVFIFICFGGAAEKARII